MCFPVTTADNAVKEFVAAYNIICNQNQAGIVELLPKAGRPVQPPRILLKPNKVANAKTIAAHLATPDKAGNGRQKYITCH
tara:strand:+ start:311 stop:553 length:243 start_codon:yes stop_codon:yes gene_type:complete